MISCISLIGIQINSKWSVQQNFKNKINNKNIQHFERLIMESVLT